MNGKHHNNINHEILHNIHCNNDSHPIDSNFITLIMITMIIAIPTEIMIVGIMIECSLLYLFWES